MQILLCCSSEGRYLLILIENYAALGLMEQELTVLKDAITIFGSSFRKDQEYTQVGLLRDHCKLGLTLVCRTWL